MAMYLGLVRFAACICLLIGGLHAFAGIATLPWLGSINPPAGPWNAALDSQDRFYGTVFAGLGAMLLTYAREPARFRPVFQIIAGAVFLGGLARLVAVTTYGWPPPLMVALIVVELVLPLVLLFWERQVSPGTDAA